jgi:glycosyltransferase involved in cell wall biosynthesis
VLPEVPVYSLPNAIDLAPYRGIAEERMSQHARNGPLRVLYLGYLGRAKGTFDLIEAATDLQSEGVGVSFDLVGEELTSGEYERLLERIKGATINGCVRLHPPAYGSEKMVFFRNAHVFVYPSYSEGMPMAVIEAMACGLPVVATKVGGLPDLVMDGVNGLLVEPGRPDQMATAFRKICHDSSLLRKMERKSHQIAFEQYSMEQRATQLVDIYRTVLSEGRAAQRVN